MDRKGKQKLKRYFIVYVIFAVFFTVGMYLITKYEENAKATQIALLLAEHPELEGEIVAIWEKSGNIMDKGTKGRPRNGLLTTNKG